jgi:hypothetical protein
MSSQEHAAKSDMPEWPSLDILYEETRELLIGQLSNVRSVDTKASIVLGANGVILAASLGLLKDVQELCKQAAKVWAVWLLPTVMLLAMLLVVVSFLLALLAYRVRNYTTTIAPRKVYEQQLGVLPEDTKLQLLHNYIDAIESNEKIVHRKVELLRSSLGFLLAALFPVVICVILVVIYVISVIRLNLA